MQLNTEINWFNKPTWPLLAAAWLGGIVGGSVIMGVGRVILPEHLAPFMLLAALVGMFFGIGVWLLWYRKELDVFSLKGWPVALSIFLGLLLSELICAAAYPRAGVLSLAGAWTLFYCVVLIGFTEELWWRGIWFAMFRGRPLLCIVAGSLLFGLAHYQLHGLRSVFMASLVGLVFAVARYRGVSIGALALAHGINDWVAQGHVVRWQWHASSFQIDAVLYTVCLALAAGIWFLRKNNRQVPA